MTAAQTLNLPPPDVCVALAFLKHWMPKAELEVVAENCIGEEGEYFCDKVREIKALIDSMPGTYEQDGKGDEAIVHLHYFSGGCDWWITEKDKGSDDDEEQGVEKGAQHQAFGLAHVGEPEIGYISIAELIEGGVELDLHFTPKKLREVKQEIAGTVPMEADAECVTVTQPEPVLPEDAPRARGEYFTPPALIHRLKDEAQDFEFYPTTDQIIGAMVKDLRSIHYYRRKYASGYESSETRQYKTLLDVGAGNGKVLMKVRDFLNRSDGERCNDRYFSTLYAIEKSPILIESLDPSIIVVGTDFEQQSLLTKNVDVIFSNPPYSVFKDWTVKLIRESAAPLVYLVIPVRWKDDPTIAEAIAYREAKVQECGEFTFEHAEDRQARARVNLLRVELSTEGDDAFERFFDAEFGDLKARFAEDREREKRNEELGEEDEKKERQKRGKFGHLVPGATYPEAMVALYNEDMAKIRRNYELAAQLDPDLMRELSISPKSIMQALRQRLTGLKNLYWKEIFDRLCAITDRLTSKKRQELLTTLNKHAHVDFTVSNIHAVVIWVLKNANAYLDEQLIETYEKMIEKANVKNYKSNTRAFKDDRWRYADEKPTHIFLEYRIVLQWMGGINSSTWSYDAGLSSNACEFLQDLLTVARNLGFLCDTADRRLLDGRKDWRSNQLQQFWRTNTSYEVGETVDGLGVVKAKAKLPDGKWQYQIGKHWHNERGLGSVLFEVRAFKNRNIHMRLNQKFALALNVEYGRLKGWVSSGAEAAEEMGEPEAAQYFRTQLRLGVGHSFLALAAPNSSHEPSLSSEATPDSGIASPSESEPETKPETNDDDMKKFDPFAGRTKAPATADPQLLAAARLLRDTKRGFAAGSHDPFWSLSGNHHAADRAKIMTTLAGKRVPQAQSGVMALRDAFYARVNPQGGCDAERLEAFKVWFDQAAPAGEVSSAPTVQGCVTVTQPVAAAAPAAPAAPAAAPTTALGQRAASVPVATYALLLNTKDSIRAAAIRAAFAAWCDTQNFTDWKQAWVVYQPEAKAITPPTPKPAPVAPATPPAPPVNVITVPASAFAPKRTLQLGTVELV